MTNREITILVCDDSMLVRKKLRESLERISGVAVLEATDGESAVELFREHKPDAVFMDIVMPLKDGIQALQEIRAIDGNAKVIMASSVGTQDNLRRAIDAGAFDFVQKPFEEGRLVGIVNRVREEVA